MIGFQIIQSLRALLRSKTTRTNKAKVESEAGFSYMETLIALLILTVLASGSAFFAAALFRAPGRILESSRESAALALLDTEFRRACGGVALPWWQTEVTAEILTIAPEEVKVRALSPAENDEIQLQMTLSRTDRSRQLIIQTAGEERTYPIPEAFVPRFAPGESGTAEGVVLLLESPDENVSITGRWRSRSIFGGHDG